MKELLEAIWHDSKVRCPCHRVWWNKSAGYFEAPKLFWRRGKKWR